MRLTPSATPLNIPWIFIASIVYSEHDGSKLHLLGKKGEMQI
jgi:hypothetical protein